MDTWITTGKMKLSIKNYSSKCEWIHKKLGVCSHLLKNSEWKTSLSVQWITKNRTLTICRFFAAGNSILKINQGDRSSVFASGKSFLKKLRYFQISSIRFSNRMNLSDQMFESCYYSRGVFRTRRTSAIGLVLRKRLLAKSRLNSFVIFSRKVAAYLTRGIMKNNCSEKFRTIFTKKTMIESFHDKFTF